MFLFTSTPTRQAAEPQIPYAAPIKEAARATGVSFDYLAKTAERESRFDPRARAQTSSATGMFQFLEQTWLGMVKQEGPKVGLTREAEAISGEGGRLSVSDPSMRQKILALREDPSISAMMAGAFANRNGQTLQQAIGRKPTDGELYVAHFLGAGGAREMIQLAERTPDARAASHFPEAAAANRSVFFERGGKARSVAEVYSNLTNAFGSRTPVATDEKAYNASKADQMFRAKGEGKGLLGLFRSQGEPVATAVAQQWSGRKNLFADTEATRVAFYPRDVAQPQVISDAQPAGVFVTEIAGRQTDVPLPPKRPDKLASRQATMDAPAEKQPVGRKKKTIGPPLDLLQFVRSEPRS